MKRGDVYRVRNSSKGDPKRSRAFVIVSRDLLIRSKYSTVICAPVFTRYNGLSTQVVVGPTEGLKHESSIHCDQLMSLAKSVLTDYLGALSREKKSEMNRALSAALDLS
ncbi:MAG: type II toxin-antitoxin system PemK/MazF family toxin [Bdellovibrionota bacterium]